ncbi:MAG: hypothetical protein HOD97_02160 [Candidatus Marinimicrobia bacterium]|nr:hypothetical protein [Candidatus Neomarinimicrobiota bacterium]MBT3617876.1 hypothetical protein [Candidatus Neomarinimicrobiota bacterium]MBT3828713.1 hypothetical protein [Candidatus Neomarinimicrobiota bacterium]MBT3996665.1 hypothetical protein [Candidatus Neomarinimicrobiota bacterium]MBT4280415.1 hypothetical protein [Candidatus Neomarinimicrobiota bacterium]
MKNENFLNLYSQERLHQQLNKCAKEIGGKNIFLQLLEAIREAQPHPLTERNCEFRFDLGTIKWRKPIFREKVSLLKHVRLVNKDGNIFPKKGIKGYKSILNLLRTLKPITFEVKPKNRKLGQGFTFQPFDIIDEKTTCINPLFESVFFSPVYQVKKILISKK